MVEAGSSNQSLQSQEDEDDINPLDAIRSRGKRKIIAIYQNVADKISASSQKKLNLTDLVMEDHIPDMTYTVLLYTACRARYEKLIFL